MFSPGHFPRHFTAGTFPKLVASVIIVTKSGAIRGGIVASDFSFKDITEQLLKEDEEILMVVVSFIEVL